jgi:hypothetical protein
MDFWGVITAYRLQIIVAIVSAWIIFLLYLIMSSRKARISTGITTFPRSEQKLTEMQSTTQKLKHENERLTLAMANMKREKIEEHIISMADEKLARMLPDKVFMFDPNNQLTGRPVYYTGNIPVFDKRKELSRMIGKSTLAKLFPSIMEKYLNWRYFGQYDTLFFYTTTYLPNGKWVITATSKPAKKTSKYMKLPLSTKTYVLLTAQQTTIDQIMLNKWEVTKANAAIELAATFLGPIPIEEFSKHFRSLGWSSGKEEKTND